MVTRLNHLIFAYHQKRCKINAFYLFPQALQRFFFYFFSSDEQNVFINRCLCIGLFMKKLIIVTLPDYEK